MLRRDRSHAPAGPDGTFTAEVNMRRWKVEGRGGVDAMVLEEVPDAAPGRGEVRVRTELSGVASGDVLHRRRRLAGAPATLVPGYDVVGVVDAVGEGVDHVAPGDRVVALPVFGGYASSVVVAGSRVARVPADVPAERAGALGLNYFVAWETLVRSARVGAGGRVLVRAAAGGVGTALLDVARALGVEAWGSASPAKHEVVRAFGAHPLDRDEGVPDLDAVFDPLGGDSWLRSLGLLRPGGTLGTIWDVTRAKLRAGSRRVATFNVLENARWPEAMAWLLAHAATLSPVVTLLPFEAAREAHARLEGRGVAGKLLLDHRTPGVSGPGFGASGPTPGASSTARWAWR